MSPETQNIAAAAAVIHAEIWPTFVDALAKGANSASALIALAQCAGDLIGLDASDAANMEEGLEIFAGLTSDQARGRFLTHNEPAGKG